VDSRAMSRRNFLGLAAGTAAGLALAGCGSSGPSNTGGGGGGGGGGGPSAALVCIGTTQMTIPMSTIMGGTGGNGGTSLGLQGAPGVSTKFIGCSFF